MQHGSEMIKNAPDTAAVAEQLRALDPAIPADVRTLLEGLRARRITSADLQQAMHRSEHDLTHMVTLLEAAERDCVAGLAA